MSERKKPCRHGPSEGNAKGQTLPYCDYRKGSISSIRRGTTSAALLFMRVRMSLVVLPEQVFAVIVAIGRAHYRVNVLTSRQPGTTHEHGPLVVKLNENHLALDAVVKYTFRTRFADPGKVRLV